MSLHGTYDSQNIFAQIIRGDLPCYKLYEDDDVLAFLDLFPQSKGHSLVIPKRAAARNILEIDDASLAKVMAVVKKVTQAVVDELQPADLSVEKVAFSAFYMSRLEWVLRKAGIETLVFSGIVTNGGVASTLRDA